MPVLTALNTLFLIDFLLILINFLKIFVINFFLIPQGLYWIPRNISKILAGIKMFVCIFMFFGLPSLLEKPAHHCYSPSWSRCTLAKVTDQHHERVSARRCAARYSPLARLVSGLRPSRWGPSGWTTSGSLNIDGRGIRGSKSESYAPSKKCNPSSGVSDTENIARKKSRSKVHLNEA